MAKVVAEIRVSELPDFKLLAWELQQLLSDMRVSASPFAERLEHALERFWDGTDRTRNEDPDVAP